MPLNLPINNTDVPEDYVGAWRKRSNIERGFWLQTHRLHASLAIPLDRPGFKGRQTWADFSDEELILLAQQGGVSGACIAQDDILHRRRQIDYLPRRGDPYLRRMRRIATLLKEETLDGREQVVWELLADGRNEIIALRFQDAGIGADSDDQRRGYLLVVGAYFMFVRDRLVATQRADSLATLIELKEPERTQLIELLDFEISFGTRTADNSPWLIQCSTIPYREGRPLMDNSTLMEIVSQAGQGPRRVRWGDKHFLRYWSLDEHQPAP
ncbi:MAG: hypothetical protein AABY73_09835 [Pseudomonadota bacterium]